MWRSPAAVTCWTACDNLSRSSRSQILQLRARTWVKFLKVVRSESVSLSTWSSCGFMGTVVLINIIILFGQLHKTIQEPDGKRKHDACLFLSIKEIKIQESDGKSNVNAYKRREIYTRKIMSSCPLHVPFMSPAPAQRESRSEPPYRRSESPTGLCLAEVVLHLPLDDVTGPRNVMLHSGIHVAGEHGGAGGRQRHLLGGCDLWGWFCGQQGDNEATTRRKRETTTTWGKSTARRRNKRGCLGIAGFSGSYQRPVCVWDSTKIHVTVTVI